MESGGLKGGLGAGVDASLLHVDEGRRGPVEGWFAAHDLRRVELKVDTTDGLYSRVPLLAIDDLLASAGLSLPRWSCGTCKWSVRDKHEPWKAVPQVNDMASYATLRQAAARLPSFEQT